MKEIYSSTDDYAEVIALSSSDYPVLAELWDNEEDDIAFDDKSDDRPSL